MEFSYKITESEYRRFAKIQDRSAQAIIFKFVRGLILFWMAVFIAVVLLWLVVNAFSPEATQRKVTSNHVEAEGVSPSTTHSGIGARVASLGPILAVLGLSVFGLFVVPWLQLRRRYRNDPLMQGTFRVILLPDSISIENTSGLFIKNEWNVFEFPRQKKRLLILRIRSGTSFPISLAGLSASEKAEARRILSAAFHKK